MENKTNRAYEIVIESIKEKIKDGTLKKGEKLRPEREIAEDLGVSRASVREAIRALDVIGIIESKQGAGNYIKETFEESIIQPLSVMFLLEQNDLTEINEFRSILESQAAVLAAERIDEEDVRELEKLIAEMSETTDEVKNTEIDRELHYIIDNASKNRVISSILNVISELIDESIKGTRSELTKLDVTNSKKLLEIHKELVDAMKNRDKKKAFEAMRKHRKIIEL
ncbi:MAG: FadR/GntR family transcriptional regulator [Clostridium perfringens]|nr:FadR/GntR family transcriptional regulator [Clostridium perfringens]